MVLNQDPLHHFLDVCETWHYTYVVVKDNVGFWAKQVENYYYQRDVLHALEVEMERALKELSKPRLINDIVRMLTLRNYTPILAFQPDSRVVHFKNGIFLLEHNTFLSNTELMSIMKREEIDESHHEYHNNIDLHIQDLRLRTFHRIPHDFVIDSPQIPEFDAFLALIFDNDQEIIQRLWEFIGLLLTTNMAFKKAGLFIGEKDSGKSTLASIIIHVIGEENHAEESFHNICHDMESTYAIMDKMLNYDDDLGEGVIEKHETFKKLTGHDTMRVRALYSNPFNYHNITHFLICANKIPYIKHLDTYIAGRFLQFTFNHQFRDNEPCECGIIHAQDHTFKDRMKTTPVAQYIIRKALLAYQALVERGYFTSATDKEMLDFFRLRSDIVYEFVHECCTRVEHAKDSAIQNEVYEAFGKWCEYKGRVNRVTSQSAFTGRMASLGFPVAHKDIQAWRGNKHTTTSKRVYKGIDLNVSKLDFLEIEEFEELFKEL